MIDPKSIELSILPSFPLKKRSKLPSIAGIYFAIDSFGTVQYIGRSTNIKQRWRCHHNQRELEALESIRIAYIVCPEDLLIEVELALIHWFAPPLNGGKMSYLTSHSMEVVKQTRVDAPDLPQRIKTAREADGRSVQVLATVAGISAAYWYQIENSKPQWISEETLRGIESALKIDLGVRFDD